MTESNELPRAGFVRLSQILRHIPVSRSSWWAGVKIGRYPPPIKLSPGVTAWRAQDIHDLIAELSNREAA